MASTFDFNKFNDVTKEASSGLKMFLAQQLLSDALSTMVKFRNPLRGDLESVIDEIISIREEGKKQAALRIKAGPADMTPEPTKTTQEVIAAAGCI